MAQSMLTVNSAIQIPDSELRFTYVRSSGPGGQNVNKVSSKAVLRWSPRDSAALPEPVRARFLEKFQSRVTGTGEIIVSSQRFRDQQRNAADCLDKLREMIVSAARKPVPRRPTKPSRASQARRLEVKRIRSHKKRRRRHPPAGDE